MRRFVSKISAVVRRHARFVVNITDHFIWINSHHDGSNESLEGKCTIVASIGKERSGLPKWSEERLFKFQGL